MAVTRTVLEDVAVLRSPATYSVTLDEPRSPLDEVWHGIAKQARDADRDQADNRAEYQELGAFSAAWRILQQQQVLEVPD